MYSIFPSVNKAKNECAKMAAHDVSFGCDAAKYRALITDGRRTGFPFLKAPVSPSPGRLG